MAAVGPFRSAIAAGKRQLAGVAAARDRAKTNACSMTKPGDVEIFGMSMNGGEEGIRTLDTLLTYTPLAGERLRPLGHLSGAA